MPACSKRHDVHVGSTNARRWAAHLSVANVPQRRVKKLEHIRKTHTLVSRDYSTRLPPVDLDDKAQHAGNEPSGARDKRPHAWKRWIGRPSRENKSKPQNDSPAIGQLSVHASLRALPTLLDGSSLPSGVVELLIDDFEDPTRQLFDIHDGHITLVEPGAAVPWASIAGPATAWVDALGAERNLSALRLTGDEELARRVLAAFPANDSLACAR